MAARLLLKRNHEVVIVEQNKEVIDELVKSLDCGFLHGNGSRPAILKEADPSHTDALLCLTKSDETNIIASLVGRSLGFKRVITKIEEPELEHICLELGLETTIIPVRTIGRYLADMCEGQDFLELSTMIRDEAAVFSFVAQETNEVGIAGLDLPSDSRVVCLYRQQKFILPDEEFKLQAGDEVVLITHRKNLPKLQERWTTT